MDARLKACVSDLGELHFGPPIPINPKSKDIPVMNCEFLPLMAPAGGFSRCSLRWNWTGPAFVPLFEVGLMPKIPTFGVKNVHFNQHILVYPSNVYCILTLATCNCCIWWLYTSKYSNFQVHCLGGYCQAVLAGLWTQFPWKVQLVSLGIAKIKSTFTGRYR